MSSSCRKVHRLLSFVPCVLQTSPRSRPSNPEVLFILFPITQSHNQGVTDVQRNMGMSDCFTKVLRHRTWFLRLWISPSQPFQSQDALRALRVTNNNENGQKESSRLVLEKILRLLQETLLVMASLLNHQEAQVFGVTAFSPRFRRVLCHASGDVLVLAIPLWKCCVNVSRAVYPRCSPMQVDESVHNNVKFLTRPVQLFKHALFATFQERKYGPMLDLRKGVFSHLE